MFLLFCLLYLNSCKYLNTCNSPDDRTKTYSLINKKGFLSNIQAEFDEDNSVYVKVGVNGKTKRFLIDTGAHTSVSYELSKELGLSVFDSLFIGDYTDSYKRRGLVLLNELALDGGICLKDIPSVELAINEVISSNADGIIGDNILQHFIIQFNKKKEQVLITDKIKEMRVGKQHLASRIQWLHNQRIPIIDFWLSTNIKEQMMFDSGATSLYEMSLHTFHQIEEHPDIANTEILESRGITGTGIFGVLVDSTNYLISLPDAKLGHNKLNKLRASTTLNKRSILGTKIFNHGIVTIDYINSNFYFQPFSKTKKINCHQEEVGFHIMEATFHNKNRDFDTCKIVFAVSNVWEGSPAFNSGLRKGMIITKINGKQPGDFKIPDKPEIISIEVIVEGMQPQEFVFSTF